MARGGGGRGRKVTINSGKWHTVNKTVNKSTNDNSDSDDEEIAKKMTNEDWQLYLEWSADVQVICVKRGELPLFVVIVLCCFSFIISSILMKQIVHNAILEEIMSTYCPETSDSYERILAETKEWIQNHR